MVKIPMFDHMVKSTLIIWVNIPVFDNMLNNTCA